MKKIALIGQANVGKSTLFNKLIEQKKAIISTTPGTTRDRNYGVCKWQGQSLKIIDTGGLEFKKGPKHEIDKQVKKQIATAINEADLVFFIIEIREAPETGVPISHFEQDIARMVKKSKKPTIFVLNKVDNIKKRQWAETSAWLKLGFGNPVLVSAANGSGVGDLLDKTIKTLKPETSDESDVMEIRVAIIGKPNVGKSTLLNSILGEEKAIVSPIPHTTRGPQDTLIYYKKQAIVLIDTAGIRKKAKIKLVIEKIGVLKSLQTIKKSDVVLFVLDVMQGLSHQDKALVDLIIKNQKALILVINKCDLLQEKNIKKLKFTLAMASWAPSVFISAKTKKNVHQILDLVLEIKNNYKKWIDSKELKEFLPHIIKEKKFDTNVWERITIYQSGIKPISFVVKASKSIIRKKLVHEAQLKIIEKQIRKKWNFRGVPIIIKLKS